LLGGEGGGLLGLGFLDHGGLGGLRGGVDDAGV
jgi:hypothetical protein